MDFTNPIIKVEPNATIKQEPIDELDFKSADAFDELEKLYDNIVFPGPSSSSVFEKSGFVACTESLTETKEATCTESSINETKEILVQFCNSNKIVKIQAGGKEILKVDEEFRKNASEDPVLKTFIGESEILFQRYNLKFKSWIDLDANSLEPLHDCEKIKCVSVKSLASDDLKKENVRKKGKKHKRDYKDEKKRRRNPDRKSESDECDDYKEKKLYYGIMVKKEKFSENSDDDDEVKKKRLKHDERKRPKGHRKRSRDRKKIKQEIDSERENWDDSYRGKCKRSKPNEREEKNIKEEIDSDSDYLDSNCSERNNKATCSRSEGWKNRKDWCAEEKRVKTEPFDYSYEHELHTYKYDRMTGGWSSNTNDDDVDYRGQGILLRKRRSKSRGWGDYFQGENYECMDAEVTEAEIYTAYLDLKNKHPVSGLHEYCIYKKWREPDFHIIECKGDKIQKVHFKCKVTVKGVEYYDEDSSPCKNIKAARKEAAEFCMSQLGLYD